MRWRLIAFLGAIALLPSGAVLAHDGRLAGSGAIDAALTTWHADPVTIILVILVGGAYFSAYRRLRREAPRFHFPRWHAWCFASGLLLLLVVQMSALDAYSDDLFWVHMLQHVIQVMAIVPLLLLGAPVTLALRTATPQVRRRWLVPILDSRALAVLTYPPLCLLLYSASIWIWHVPTLYDAAIQNEAVHFLEHASFLAGATFFWWMVIGVDATHTRPHYVARAAVLIAAIMQAIALGVILTGLDHAVYRPYEAAAALREWGPDAVTDQKIGAGIMWVPGSMMYGLAVVATFYFWAEHEGFRGRRGDLVRELAARRAAATGSDAQRAPGG